MLLSRLISLRRFAILLTQLLLLTLLFEQNPAYAAPTPASPTNSRPTAPLAARPAAPPAQDYSLGSWVLTGGMNTPRNFHTVTLLANGKVLVVGGSLFENYASTSKVLASTEIYDPATGQWTITGSLNIARENHVATLLPNGKVLVAGGFQVNSVSNTAIYLNSAELYDPATGQWTLTGSLKYARAYFSATLLPNGKVLAAGGEQNANYLPSAAELYDPATGQWTTTGTPNVLHSTTYGVLLSTGKVLIMSRYGRPSTVELYDPATGQWTITASLNKERYSFALTQLSNGKILVTGGYDDFYSVDDCELYDPATGTWTVTGKLNTPRSAHDLVTMPDGKALAIGGISNQNNVISGVETYDPATGKWTYSGNMNYVRSLPKALTLPDGSVLVTNDASNNTGPLYVELYVKLAFYPLPAPVRWVDTRAGAPGRFSGGGQVGPTNTRNYAVAGQAYSGVTLPPTARAVAGTVQVAAPGAAGYLTAYSGPADPSGNRRPTSATMLFNPGQYLANDVNLTLGSDGSLNFFSSTATDLVFDISGYYALPGTPDPNNGNRTDTGLAFYLLPQPVRLLDTRTDPGTQGYITGGGPIPAGTARNFTFSGFSYGGTTIPAGARALVGNVQVATPDAIGFITAYPGAPDPTGAARPTATNLLYNPGQYLANSSTLLLDSSGRLNLYAHSTANLLIDVVGYFAPIGSAPGGLLYSPLTRPIRLLDTRNSPGVQGLYTGAGPIAANTSYSNRFTGVEFWALNIPRGVSALVGNVQVAAPASAGFLTVYPGPADPTGANHPTAASLLYNPGQYLANAVVAGVDGAGQLNLYAFTTTQVVLDINGYFAP